MKNMAKKLLMAAMCLLISLTMVPALTNTTKTMAAEQTGDKNGLYHEGNSWNYYTHGKINTARTLVKYNGTWWYVHDGRIDFGANTLVKYNGTWWYVHGGKVDFGTRTLIKYNKTWWFVEGGQVRFNATGLCKYNGSWWYIRSGKVDFSATTLCKYNGSWWYIRNGKVDFSATTLCKYNGSWWYIKNGKVDFSATTLCKYNGSWWYIKNGKVDFSATTLCKYNGIWWYVENGMVKFNYNGLAQNEYGSWKITNGKVDFVYNGAFEKKKIVNGRVVSEDFDGYDRYGNKFVEKYEAEAAGAYIPYLDADNPYPLDSYEWADNDKCLYIIKDIGVFPASELEEQLDVLDSLDQTMINMWDEKNSQDNRGVTLIPAVIGCYNGHWIVKYELIIADDLNKYTSEVFFYDKNGNPWRA